MPDGVELPPHDLIERLEQAVLDSEVLNVDLVGPPELLETGIHGPKHRSLDPNHGWRHGHPDVQDLGWGTLEVSRDEDVEPRPEVEAADKEGLHNALGLGEAGDHRLGPIGEGMDGGRGGVVPEDAGDEGLGRGVGEAMSVEHDKGGNGGWGDAGGEEVGYEDAGSDEEGSAGGVESSAVVRGEVAGDIRGKGEVRLPIPAECGGDGGLLGVGGGEEEERASGGVMKEEEGGDEGREGKARGEDDQAAVGVVEQVGDDQPLEGEHR